MSDDSSDQPGIGWNRCNPSSASVVLCGSPCRADDEQEEWREHGSQTCHPPLFQSQGRPRRGRPRLGRSLDDDMWTPENHSSGHHRRDRPASADDDQAKRWLIRHLPVPSTTFYHLGFKSGSSVPSCGLLPILFQGCDIWEAGMVLLWGRPGLV